MTIKTIAEADLAKTISEKAFDIIVLRGDYRYWLPRIPKGCIDLTITDPPYASLEKWRSLGTTTRLKQSDKSSNDWFNCIQNEDIYALFEKLFELHGPNTHCYTFCDSETEHITMCGHNPYATNRARDRATHCPDGKEWKPVSDTGWKIWQPLIWMKTRNHALATNPELENTPEDLVDEDLRMGLGYHWRRCEERIMFMEKGNRRLNNLGLKCILLGKRAGCSDYPTQKPYNVITRLLLNSSNPGNIVLDPFAGSGVVGHSAAANYRKAILIDVTTDWIEEYLLPHGHPDAKLYIAHQPIGTAFQASSDSLCATDEETSQTHELGVEDDS